MERGILFSYLLANLSGLSAGRFSGKSKEDVDGLVYGREVAQSLVDRFGLNLVDAATAGKILFESVHTVLFGQQQPDVAGSSKDIELAAIAHPDYWFFRDLEGKVEEHERLFLETAYVISYPADSLFTSPGDVVDSANRYKVVVFYNARYNEIAEFCRAFARYLESMKDGAVLSIKNEFGARRFKPYQPHVNVLDEIVVADELLQVDLLRSQSNPRALSIIGLRKSEMIVYEGSIQEHAFYSMDIRKCRSNARHSRQASAA